MWKCKRCGEEMIGFAETKFYVVDKNGNILKDELENESSFVCLECDYESNNINDIAYWEDDNE